MRRLVIGAEARAALLEATAWNREHSDPEFFKRFAKTIREALAEIAERPMMWPVAKGATKIRARHLLTIRYTVFYRVNANMVAITGFRHMRRGPRTGKTRR
jgi:hypothetical protein